MNKQTFQQLLSEENFKELFVTELGWNRWKGNSQLLPITIDDVDYNFNVVAVRNGLQILVAKVKELPNTSLARRIDAKLRKQAQDYISIYVVENETGHHQWVIPVKNVDKRDLVSIEYADPAKTDFLYSKMDDLEFGTDENTTIIDVKESVHKAFSVNSEKITKDFYTGFKKEHIAFTKFIKGIDDDIDVKVNRNKQWYASVMLNRLMFCYFIQKKGFLDGNLNYLRDKLNQCIAEKGQDQFFSTFYLAFLRQLFADGLNKPSHDREFEKKYGRIPYLNGGMFDRHQIERDYADINIADEAFVSLFDFFDRWQWHLDTRITASGKDINPDVLGYIFEQYINDRAQMGAYYTKEDITEYIGRNTILPFLFDKVSHATQNMEEEFSPKGWVWQTLKTSGDRYLFDAVKQGWTPDWSEKIPQDITVGLDTEAPDLLARRARWNDRTPEPFALPTEIWRETIERLQRVDSIMAKISAGEITSVNDFITYNLDIRLFASDLIAKSESGSFVYNFYDALRSVTILDPTCGSGAFLFAAMNILDPLYYECISRLEEFKSDRRVKEALDEISQKYRSNIHYFIYKSIILRNLYGVDLMTEATEIAKLRLFLKMVAVVDVDYRADNLGLDPLPDIDFNIRCGNTLVGYANEKEIEQDLTTATDILQELANQEFKERIEQEMQTVAATYREFKRLQLVQEEHFAEFKQAKAELQSRLNTLNDTLSRRLFIATKGDPGEQMFQLLFEEWLASHHPFHWVAEFYQIIHGNGGFDVIIGNPPYVVYTDAKSPYIIGNQYKTRPCANLYAFCVERCQSIILPKGKFGMIVPNSSISADKLSPLQEIITHNHNLWVSNYSWRPSKLFEGADMLLAILITSPTAENEERIFATKYNKWQNEYRICLFKTLAFNDVTPIKRCGTIAKLPNALMINILNKMKNVSKNVLLNHSFSQIKTNWFLFYFRAVQYWFKVLDREPIYNEDGTHCVTGEMKPIYAVSDDYKNVLISVLSSSLFFVNYITWSSCQVVNSRDFEIYTNLQELPKNLLELLSKLGKTLQEDYQNNSHVKTRNYSKKGREFTMEKQHFFIKYSKPIIDEIDKVLARHYGFTDEELDFIINYDIKHRMGDELNIDSDE